MASLQIFIPSFRREEPLKKLLKNAVADGVTKQAFIHVTDDGDCNWDFVEQMVLRGLITSTVHKVNMGYALTLIEGVLTSEQSHILIVNDDDVVDAKGVGQVALFLDQVDFLSTNHLGLDGTINRGGPSTHVSMQNARTYSQHAPGLVFKCDAVRAVADFVRNRVQLGCSFSRIYPQVALLWGLLLIGGSGRHENIVVCSEASANPSQLSMNGQKYWHPAARFQQKMDAIEFLSSFKRFDGCDQGKVDAAVALERKSLGWIVYDSLRTHDPELSKRFAASVLKERLKELLTSFGRA